MHLLIAPDTFKDALSADKVADAFARGVKMSSPEFTCTLLPLADGGEGTASIMTNALGGEVLELPALDPLLRPMQAQVGWISHNKTGIVELAAASGLALLKPSERNPLHTSTYGTGLLIRELLDRGMEHLYLTLGGSATNDMACGTAAALGWKFFNGKRSITHPTGKDLGVIDRIDSSEIHPGLSRLKVTVLCDVNNPLYGPNGAAHIYGRQKGADEDAIHLLDDGLQQMANLILQQRNKDVAHVPGSGAAGGCGAGAIAFLNGKLTPGIDAILMLSGFEEKLQQADLVVTGEGSIDEQTFTGKVVKGVANLCRIHHKPVIGICGLLQLDYRQVKDLGLIAAFPISNGAVPLSEALKDTERNVVRLGAMLSALFNTPGEGHS